MKNIAAYLLLQLGGKSTPTAADITSVLEAAGAEVDSSRIEKLIGELEGKDINEVRPSGARRDGTISFVSMLSCGSADVFWSFDISRS